MREHRNSVLSLQASHQIRKASLEALKRRVNSAEKIQSGILAFNEV